MADVTSNVPAVVAALEREALRNLERAAIVLKGKVKDVLSVPAPRKRVTSRKGVIYYRATTPALPGAPPRKLSGRLRASVDYQMMRSEKKARVGTNVIYGRPLETRMNHKFLITTLNANAAELGEIMAGRR